MADEINKKPEEEAKAVSEDAADEKAQASSEASIASSEKSPAAEQGFFQYREGVPSGESYQPSEDEIRRRKRRNVAIALGVVGFIIMVYLITIIRLGINTQGGV